ncbi:MAG: alanine/glycine:cation symporter family protein [Planctomycetota bacterium]
MQQFVLGLEWFTGYFYIALMAMLIVVGLLLTISSRFVQFRYFLRMFRVLRQATAHEGNHVSPFQALVLSVAGRVGGGNIIGVAVALTLGGPGAIFWMWVLALIGMASSFFECALAQLYKRSEPDGTYRGGPAYYILHGLKQPWMAVVFSVLLFVTYGFCLNAFQSFGVAETFNDAFGAPTWIIGLIMAVLVGLIIFGGVKRIASVTEFLVPIMAIGYILLALFVLVKDIDEVPGVLWSIVANAVGLDTAFAGGVGAAISQGVRRGLLSNEAGMGSAPNVAAVAYARHPASQGVIQSFSVFVDTIIMCTCTATIILLADGTYPPDGQVAGLALTQNALAEHIGAFAKYFVVIALLMFAFSTVLYNYYLGETALSSIVGERRSVFYAFRIFILVLIFVAAVLDLDTVLAFTDLSIGLMAMTNLFALLFLYKIAMRLLADYDGQLKAGNDHPSLDASKFNDLDLDRTAWKDDQDYD